MEAVAKTLDDFFAHKEMRVVCIKGKWGVGKTYFWKNYISKKKNIFQSPYSYISLFGAKQLDDVRSSIVVNAIQIDDQNNLKGLQSVVRKYSAKIIEIAKELPHTSGYKGVISILEKALVSRLTVNYLICFDDLERRSKDLPMQEILGLASELKEERNCRVAFILNEGELSDDDQKELQIYKEKVVDLEIEYNPVVAENFNLIFNSGQDHYKFLLNKMEVLDLKNIRILKMIKRNIDSLAYLMDGIQKSLREEIIIHLALISYAHLSSEFNISTDFLKSYNMMQEILRAGQNSDNEGEEKEECCFLDMATIKLITTSA